MNNIKIKKKLIKLKNNSLMPIYYINNKNINNNNNKIIVVIKEINKINKYFKKICKKISKNNYIVAMPELLFEIKNKKKKKIKSIKKEVNNMYDKNLLFNINETILWLKKKYMTNKIGIVGFCWGGRLTWLYSYFYDYNILSSVIWCGKLINKINNKNPIHPINISDKIKIPTLGIYGNKYKNIYFKIIKKMNKKIKKKNKKNKIIIYNNTYHEFYDKNKKTYNKKNSKKAWKEMLNWFNKYIK